MANMATAKRKSWLESRWPRAVTVPSSSYPATHHRLRCSRPGPQPTFYHSNPGLRLIQQINKAQGLGFHLRRQGCSCEGEQIMPRMPWANVTWISVLPPSCGGGGRVRGCPGPPATPFFPTCPHTTLWPVAQRLMHPHQEDTQSPHRALAHCLFLLSISLLSDIHQLLPFFFPSAVLILSCVLLFLFNALACCYSLYTYDTGAIL